jgi:hypothetical protein
VLTVDARLIHHTQSHKTHTGRHTQRQREIRVRTLQASIGYEWLIVCGRVGVWGTYQVVALDEGGTQTDTDTHIQTQRGGLERGSLCIDPRFSSLSNI